MTDQITLEEALELVTFRRNACGTWCVYRVLGNVRNNVLGNVIGTVYGNVGFVGGNVKYSVGGTIAGRAWKLIETPEQKFRRLLDETENQELIDAFNQLEGSDD